MTQTPWKLQWRDRKGILCERTFETLEAAKTFGKTLPFRSVPFLELDLDQEAV
jgi:hypothetical protein